MSDFLDLYQAANFWKGLLYDHPQGVRKDTAWSMGGIGADFVGFTHTAGIQIAEKLGAALPEGAGLPVIEAGLVAMMGMANMLGVGDPETGNRFATGANKFNGVSEALSSTHPPDSWEGSGSDAYAERNNEQRERALQMAENDKTVKEVLDREAEQVEKTRETIDHMSTVVTAAIVPAYAALSIPVAGEAASLAIQATAVGVALPICIDKFQSMVSDAAHNATLVRRVGAGYDRIASGGPTGTE